MNILGVIPSRYASTRFPGKPLIDIDGKTMIQRVYEQAKKASSLIDVVVATDDDRIFKEVRRFGGNVVMTSPSHESGTERCNEVLENFSSKIDVVVNVQGDEPFVDPEQINQLCSCFDDKHTDIATLVKEIKDNEELFNPNRPKVEIGENGFAKMFSRDAIPVIKGVKKTEWLNQQKYYKHIGLYGYRVAVLRKICKLTPSPLEIKEQLEQLRWLENNYKIKVAETTFEAIAIDTPEDLKKIAFK